MLKLCRCRIGVIDHVGQPLAVKSGSHSVTLGSAFKPHRLSALQSDRASSMKAADDDLDAANQTFATSRLHPDHPDARRRVQAAGLRPGSARFGDRSSRARTANPEALLSHGARIAQ